MVNEKKWIVLNVGGTYFMTSRSTLIRSTPPSSPLHRISSNSTKVDWDRDEKGAYMIDRDPLYFQPVLNFLRHGSLVINHDVPEEAILLEAEYFNLPELIKAVKQRINYRRFLLACGQAQQTMSARQQLQTLTPTGSLETQNNFLGYQLNNQNQAINFSQFQARAAELSSTKSPGKQVAIDQCKQPCINNNQFVLAQKYQTLRPLPSSISSDCSMNSLINQQDYLTSYVNNILEEDAAQA